LLRGTDSVRERAAAKIKHGTYPSFIEVILLRAVLSKNKAEDASLFFELCCDCLTAVPADVALFGSGDLDRRGDNELAKALVKGKDLGNPETFIESSHDLIFLPRSWNDQFVKLTLRATATQRVVNGTTAILFF